MRESASRPSPRRQPAPLPPAPSARRPLDVLVEIPTPLGLALWRALADAALWADAGPGAALFRAPGAEAWGTDDPDVGGALWSLSLVRRLPWRESAPELAAGAARIAEWAEQQGHKETAAQFAHLAARLEPGAAAYATTAGRLHRRLGDAVRAQLWLRRAVRLARTGGREIDFAIAHLAWGNLDHDAGRFLHAEHHFCKGYRAALRAGRRSLAGAAQHDLLGVKIHTQRFDEAWEHAWRAVEMYAAHHPRFPLLGHDIAFLIHTLGHYSSALPVLEKVLPLVPFQRERILVLASTARAAGAVRDRLRFERTAAAVVELAAEDSEMSAGALYHVAQGARSFEQWERAAELAARARRSAAARGNQTVAALAGALLSELQRREGGDEDRIPPEGGEVDRMVALVLKRLQKHTAPRDRRAVPPERFPTY